jgi:hypothetical protein
MHKKQRPAIANPLAGNSVSIQPSKVATGNVFVNTIESPPINGFIPWIAVTATNKRAYEVDLNAYLENSLDGDYFPDNSEGDFVIGLFDTGASAHVIGYESAETLGIKENMETGNYIEIRGVTGSVYPRVTLPLGVFIAGFDAIDPVSMTVDSSVLVGQSNVAIAAGDYPESGAPDLPTAIGSPMSVFFDTVFKYSNTVFLSEKLVLTPFIS